MRSAAMSSQVGQGGIFGKKFLELRVGFVDVAGITRERDPAERSDAAAEERPDVGRYESRKGERVAQSGVARHLPNVVAVIKRRNALPRKRDHRGDLLDHRRFGRALDAGGIVAPRARGFVERPACREIAVARIVRAGLVGDEIGPDAAPDQFGEEFGRVAEHADGDGALLRARFADDCQRFVERGGAPVEIARLQPAFDARRIALDRQQRGTRHGRGQRLRAAHPAQTRGEDPAAAQIAAVMLPARLHERLVRALHDALRADVDPRPGGHLAVHREAAAIEFVEVFPGRPVRDEIRVRDEHPRCVGVGGEDADGFSRLHEQRLIVVEPAQHADDGVETRASRARPCRCRRTPRDRQAVRRPRGRDCS